MGVDPAAQRQYVEHYAATNQWIVGHDKYYVTGAVTNSLQFTTDAELERTEYYTDFLRHYDWMYAHGVVIERNTNLIAFMTGLRNRAAGPFTEAEEELSRRLFPHLRRAFAIHERLSLFDGCSHAMDSVNFGMLLVGSGGRVLLMNSGAHRMLSEADGLRLHKNHLVSTDSTQTRDIQACIDQILRARHGKVAVRRNELAVRRPSLKRPYLLLSMPLCSQSRPMGISVRAEALVLIIDAELGQQTSVEYLRSALALTATEAAIVLMLLNGKTLESAADDMSITYATARTHLRNIFRKTGAQRQSDLFRLVPSLPIAPSLKGDS